MQKESHIKKEAEKPTAMPEQIAEEPAEQTEPQDVKHQSRGDEDHGIVAECDDEESDGSKSKIR